METLVTVSPFLKCGSCVATRMPENIDIRNLHIEYRDPQGVVFARFAKVYKKTGLFHLFNADSHLHGELKDADGNLLLTTTSYWGATKREAKVQIHHPDGALFGTLYDANWGADFELPDGAAIGKARRPPRPENEPQSEPTEVVHTFTDASGKIVGTCDRHELRISQEERNQLLEVLTLAAGKGALAQAVTLTTDVDAALHTFLFLFPALQLTRAIRLG